MSRLQSSKLLASKLPAAKLLAGGLAILALALAPARVMAADAGDVAGAGTGLAYADLVDMVEPAPLVLSVQVRKVAQVEPERARDVPAGWARIYVEARGLAALRGALPPAETLSYLADVRLDAKGRLPELAKRNVLLIARPVAGHPEMLQLVAPDAQLPGDGVMASRVRAVLDALDTADAPSPVTRVREAMYVPGTLVGEGETQIFLATANGSPAAITVVHPAGQLPNSAASWSASFSEVMNAAGTPPARDTLAWYRLACFLPGELPAGANVSATPADQAQAVDDYHLVIAGLGPCGRMRR